MVNKDPHDDGRLARGRAVFEEFSGCSADGFMQSLSVSPAFAARALSWEFADVMSSTTLDRRVQEIIALATFATLGTIAAPVLKFRISTALRAGVTRQEIVEVFNQLALAVGLPTSLAALKIAQDVFQELDAAALTREDSRQR
jgi:4-carboxymuconolactone decarboxylase